MASRQALASRMVSLLALHGLGDQRAIYTGDLDIRAAQVVWSEGTSTLELLPINGYFPEVRHRQQVFAVINATVGDPGLESFVEAL